jgi:integrase
LFWTGLRTSEVIALRWDDVDWQRMTIRVRRAITRAARGIAEDTKTIAGRRDVKLLAPALQAQKIYTFLADAEIFNRPGYRGKPGGS